MGLGGRVLPGETDTLAAGGYGKRKEMGYSVGRGEGRGPNTWADHSS